MTMTTIIFTDAAGRHFTPAQLDAHTHITALSGEPADRTIMREVLRYRTEGMTARDLADAIPPDDETGLGGILHYATFATVSADFSHIIIDLAFAIDEQKVGMTAH
jgi:hypothetical protein